jgi:hypothetical protein
VLRGDLKSHSLHEVKNLFLRIFELLNLPNIRVVYLGTKEKNLEEENFVKPLLRLFFKVCQVAYTKRGEWLLWLRENDKKIIFL